MGKLRIKLLLFMKFQWFPSHSSEQLNDKAHIKSSTQVFCLWSEIFVSNEFIKWSLIPMGKLHVT